MKKRRRGPAEPPKQGSRDVLTEEEDNTPSSLPSSQRPEGHSSAAPPTHDANEQKGKQKERSTAASINTTDEASLEIRQEIERRRRALLAQRTDIRSSLHQARYERAILLQAKQIIDEKIQQVQIKNGGDNNPSSPSSL